MNVTTQQVLASLTGYPRNLQWTNFRNVTNSPNPPFTAQTGSSYAWTHGRVVLQSDGYYRFRSVRVTVRLNSQQSWKVTSWYNNASTTERAHLLEHERGHYHITGLIARDLCRELLSLEMSDEIVSVLRDVGDSAQARLQYASRELLADARQKGQDADNLYRWLENANVNGVPREGQYERDTGHGRLRRAQQKWTEIFNHSQRNDTALSLMLTMRGCGAPTGNSLGTCVSNAVTP